LLRDLADAAETYPAAIWPGQIAGALRRLIHAANQARDKNLAAVAHDIAVPLIHAFRHGVLAGLSEIPRRPGRKQHPCRDLLECLRDRRGDVLRFVSDLRIPPTSNDAERDLRPAKTQQKISGRLRSEQATRHRYAIRGYLSTAAKHGINVLAALRDALESHPWMPPIPTPHNHPADHIAPPCTTRLERDECLRRLGRPAGLMGPRGTRAPAANRAWVRKRGIRAVVPVSTDTLDTGHRLMNHSLYTFYLERGGVLCARRTRHAFPAILARCRKWKLSRTQHQRLRQEHLAGAAS
jgi:hypothetical protein